VAYSIAYQQVLWVLAVLLLCSGRSTAGPGQSHWHLQNVMDESNSSSSSVQ
jgi:hypothetical protein